MKWSYRSRLRPLLAVACIACCCPVLLIAQNPATNADSNQAVTQQLQKMQEQLDQQQRQIHQLQGQLLDAQQQLKSVNTSTSSDPTLVPASYPAASLPGAAVASAPEGPPPKPTVIPAVAPLRTLPVDAPKTGGLVGIKIGPVTLRPYGFIKATAAKDTSNPNGDDFPFVGLFLTQSPAAAGHFTTTGPTLDPTFFVKARSTRFGMNIEWPDVSKKLTLTGRIEGDFEGNFNESDNRDVSSIRSNNPNLRLAFVRMDYHASDTTNVYFEGGQDWTLFGSSALPPILETTFLMAYYGAVYERSPQLLGGIVQTLTPTRNLKLSGTFGIMMPTSSQIEKLTQTNQGLAGFEGQIGQAEVEGADSGRPEVEGRVALQFQLDQAKGVAPAQILVSGFQGRRRSVVPSTAPASYLSGGNVFNLGPGGVAAADAYATAFPNGFTSSSEMYGGQVAVQLPTRWFTLVASAYRGGDLRFFFGGQVNSYATDLTGLTNPVSYVTLDGGPYVAAGSAVLATNSAGTVVVAPQKPIRSFGGFVSAGFPLSRIFNASPEGHNAGWQLYLTAGKDQIVDRDLKNPNYDQTVANILSPLPLSMGKMAAFTLFYKVNQWASFGFEQSIYATRIEFGAKAYSIAGVASNEWQDHRTEFGPTFTF